MPVRVESNRPIVCFEMKGYFPHCDAPVARQDWAHFLLKAVVEDALAHTHSLSLWAHSWRTVRQLGAKMFVFVGFRVTGTLRTLASWG